MATYDKFTYDLGHLELSKGDKAELEKDFDGPGEYTVYIDETANLAARGEILSNLWTFRPTFLADITNLPSEVFSCLQEKMGEDCNYAILVLVRSNCGENSIIESAISANNRGHFLAHYDSKEIEYKTKSGKVLYLYRCD